MILKEPGSGGGNDAGRTFICDRRGQIGGRRERPSRLE